MGKVKIWWVQISFPLLNHLFCFQGNGRAVYQMEAQMDYKGCLAEKQLYDGSKNKWVGFLSTSTDSPLSTSSFHVAKQPF